MRTSLVVIAMATLTLLAACGPKEKPVEPPPETTAPVVDEAPAVQALTGIFSAASTTAMGITGDLSVIAERVTLSKGEQFETAPAVSPRSLNLAAGEINDRWYATPAGVEVEYRKVTASTVQDGTTPQKICGDKSVGQLTFTYDAARANVTMIAFSGDEMPGLKSKLCGTFLYAG